MKRILSITLAIFLVFSLASCAGESKTATEVEETHGERTETHENMCVDIGVNEDGYYALMSDVEIHYGESGNPEWVYIDDPVLLAFCVSSEMDGGVYILDLTEGEKVITELTEIAIVLEDAGLDEYAQRIYSVLEIISNSGPFTQAST